MESILTIVKNNGAVFDFYRNSRLYYNIINKEGLVLYSFNVDISDKKDIGSSTFNFKHKAITLMRYIRKSIENDELIVYKMKELARTKEVV